MKAFALGALALTLGLGGCMHAAHHDHMQGMIGQHQDSECPSQTTHEAGAAGGQAHDHSAQGAAQADCPPGDASQHQHNQPQD